MKNDLIQHARRYATEMHERIDQRRKYTLAPYDVHLKAVADLVATVSSDPEMIAAAWLHDTVEDTQATFEDLEREFGTGVMQLVMELTDISKPGDGNRAVRKELDRRHTAGASARAKTVKLADVIDNTRDIAKHDPRFAKVYLPEMYALLEVLAEGDSRLYQKACKTVAECAGKLGIIQTQGRDLSSTEMDPEGLDASFTQFRGLRLFTESFTARHILNPLRSFDHGTSRDALRDVCDTADVSVVGIREQGRLSRYLLGDDLASNSDPQPRKISDLQNINLDTPLADIIHVLTLHSHCFVSLEGDIIGVISRVDMEKPVVRMWLFGLIMLIDLLATNNIRENWKGDSWHSEISEARLGKAKELYLERQRCNKSGSLLECLQLSDKLQIMFSNRDNLEVYGFASVSAVKRVIKALESLRNNLAHGQEINSSDWPAIARLAWMLVAPGNKPANRVDNV